MIEDNINLAYKVFWQYYPKLKNIIEFEEGISICLEGLVKAAKHYDESKGFTFSTFAYPVIKNHLLATARKFNTNKVNTISLDTIITTSEDSYELSYFIADSFNIEEDVEHKLTIELLQKFIIDLPPIHRQIMELYLQGMTQQEIATKLNLSQTQISRIFNKSINILRVKFSRKEMM